MDISHYIPLFSQWILFYCTQQRSNKTNLKNVRKWWVLSSRSIIRSCVVVYVTAGNILVRYLVIHNVIYWYVLCKCIFSCLYTVYQYVSLLGFDIWAPHICYYELFTLLLIINAVWFMFQISKVRNALKKPPFSLLQGINALKSFELQGHNAYRSFFWPKQHIVCSKLVSNMPILIWCGG